MSGIDQNEVIDGELARIMRESDYAISRTEAMHRLVSEWEQSRAEPETSGGNISVEWDPEYGPQVVEKRK